MNLDVLKEILLLAFKAVVAAQLLGVAFNWQNRRPIALRLLVVAAAQVSLVVLLPLAVVLGMMLTTIFDRDAYTMTGWDFLPVALFLLATVALALYGLLTAAKSLFARRRQA